jgi:hypothetical protein
MSQIGEELIKEIGQIKKVILSHRKIRLDYEVDIVCQEIVVQKIKVKVRYLKVDDIYRMYFPKDSFLNSLSNKLRVKKNKIHWGTIWHPNAFYNNLYDTGKTFEIDEYLLNNFIKSIYISDDDWFIQWNRDRNINKILK